MRLTIQARVGLLVLFSFGIFFLIGFHIGAFRLNKDQYARYYIHFSDSSGLQRRSEVRIAGVPVGWVDDISIGDTQVPRAVVLLSIQKIYTLYKNTQAMIRQDGILGAKYIELLPGTIDNGVLPINSVIVTNNQEAVCLDDLISIVQDASYNAAQVSQDISKGLAPSGFQSEAEQVRRTLHAVSDVVNQLASLDIPHMMHQSMAVLQRAERSFASIDAAMQVVAHDDLRHHVHESAAYIHGWLDTLNRLFITCDGHVEIFVPHLHQRYRHTFCAEPNKGKGFFDVRLHTGTGYFLQAQIIASEYRRHLHSTHAKQHHVTWGLQVGRAYKEIFAVRVGIFEGTAGFGFDLCMPLPSSNVIWISSGELFDFHAVSNTHDRPLYSRWINRIFFGNTVYVNCGFNDFCSRHNASFFCGIGLVVGQDAIQHFFR